MQYKVLIEPMVKCKGKNNGIMVKNLSKLKAKNMEKEIIVYESHQDSVVSLPEGSVELAYNQKCIQAFQLYDTLYSVQFHPEFSLDIMKKYVSGSYCILIYYFGF